MSQPEILTYPPLQPLFDQGHPVHNTSGNDLIVEIEIGPVTACVCAIAKEDIAPGCFVKEVREVFRGHERGAVLIHFFSSHRLLRCPDRGSSFGRGVDGRRVTGKVTEGIAGLVGSAHTFCNALHDLMEQFTGYGRLVTRAAP